MICASIVTFYSMNLIPKNTTFLYIFNNVAEGNDIISNYIIYDLECIISIKDTFFFRYSHSSDLQDEVICQKNAEKSK